MADHAAWGIVCELDVHRGASVGILLELGKSSIAHDRIRNTAPRDDLIGNVFGQHRLPFHRNVRSSLLLLTCTFEQVGVAGGTRTWLRMYRDCCSAPECRVEVKFLMPSRVRVFTPRKTFDASAA
jgi:hypothetical protein